MKTKNANTSLYLPDKLKTKLKMHAIRKKVHISTVITEAIEEYLK